MGFFCGWVVWVGGCVWSLGWAGEGGSGIIITY